MILRANYLLRATSDATLWHPETGTWALVQRLPTADATPAERAALSP
jgi:hypothetical protein